MKVERGLQMPEQPPRRETMGGLYAKVWPNATPEDLAQLIALFGDPEGEVCSLDEVIRSLEEENEE